MGKTFAVIELISQNAEGVTFSEIVATLAEPKATVYRILQTLEQNNWVEKRQDRYVLGYMLIHYGLIALGNRDIRTQALPFLKELTDELHESSHLAVLSGKKSMILEVAESSRHIKPSSTIGSLLPTYCTSHGKILLAFAVEERLEEFLRGEKFLPKTKRTLTSLDDLKREIEKIRRLGYAMDDLEYYDDVRCLAAPVWGPGRKCIGALGITATTMTFPEERIEEIAAIVCGTAERLSLSMGGRAV